MKQKIKDLLKEYGATNIKFKGRTSFGGYDISMRMPSFHLAGTFAEFCESAEEGVRRDMDKLLNWREEQKRGIADWEKKNLTKQG